MNTPKQPARMGRPPRFPEEGARIGHSLRLKPSIDKALRGAAEKNSRSLAEEMEHRINLSFERENVTYSSIVSSEKTDDLTKSTEIDRIILEATLQAEFLEIDRQLSFAHTRIFICIEKMENLILKARIAERDNSFLSFIQTSPLSKKIGLSELFSNWFKAKNDADIDIMKVQRNAINLEHELAQDERDLLRVRRKEKIEQMRLLGVSPWNISRKKLTIGEFLKRIYVIEDIEDSRPTTK